MSTTPDTEFNLDSLFLPAWAQQPANKNLYAKFEGHEEREPRRGDRGGDSFRRPRPGGPGGPGRPGESRGQGQGQRPPPSRDRREGGRPPQGSGPRPDHRPERPPERPAPEVLPEVDVQFRPDEHGIDSLVRQIKMAGRAYPLFAIAQIVLEKAERHSVVFTARKKADGTTQSLFVCALDDSLWLTEDEAVDYVLRKHFQTFYQPERTQTEPPKGTYTFVAQCGISGIILGPPNHHDYQNQLRKLHADRFGRMPFDMFKSRVRIVREEEVVKKWIDEQSWKTEYNCLNVPEPLKLATREDVATHFRQTHLAEIIKLVESHTISGVESRVMACRPLQRLACIRWEDQQRFPLQLATLLSQQFATRGLQFFKVNKTVTHVSVARPQFLEIEITPVSDGVKRIIEFINAHPKGTRRQLFHTLAPSALPTVQPAAEGAAPQELTPEASAVISDLHWLVHQGHVIEFANGILETAKKPQPRPLKAEPKAKAPQTTPEETAAGVPVEPAAPAATDVAPEIADSGVETTVSEVSEPQVSKPVAESRPPEPAA